MNRSQIVGNPGAKKAFTLIAIRALAVLCLLGAFGAFMAKWSREGDLKHYIDEGTVSLGRVLSARQDESTIVWNNGDRGKTKYNFVRVVHAPDSGAGYADYVEGKAGKASLIAPPADATDENTRLLSVSDASLAALKPGQEVEIVTHRYDSSGAMLLSEITRRDYSTHHALIALFTVLAAGLWLLGRRIKRS